MCRYIVFHDKRHPQDRGPREIEAFLTSLAVEGHGARSTQNQAFNALLFLSRDVLGISLDDAGLHAVRAHKKGTLPRLGIPKAIFARRKRGAAAGEGTERGGAAHNALNFPLHQSSNPDGMRLCQSVACS